MFKKRTRLRMTSLWSFQKKIEKALNDMDWTVEGLVGVRRSEWLSGCLKDCLHEWITLITTLSNDPSSQTLLRIGPHAVLYRSIYIINLRDKESRRKKMELMTREELWSRQNKAWTKSGTKSFNEKSNQNKFTEVCIHHFFYSTAPLKVMAMIIYNSHSIRSLLHYCVKSFRPSWA